MERSVVEVAMRRESLEDIPDRPLPDGLSLREFRAGDDATWTALQVATGVYRSIRTDLHAREFGEDLDELAARQRFAVDADGLDVATATAWRDADGDPATGRIHWVAVVPPWQRRGLGAALTCEACRLLRRLGHRRATLTTGSANLPAIHLYLALGFVPHARSEEERTAWADLRGKLASWARHLVGPGN